MQRARDGHKHEMQMEVEELWALSHNIIESLASGQSQKDVVGELNVSHRVVSYTANSPIIRDMLANGGK